jgi:hypothetical protein
MLLFPLTSLSLVTATLTPTFQKFSQSVAKLINLDLLLRQVYFDILEILKSSQNQLDSSLS